MRAETATDIFKNGTAYTLQWSRAHVRAETALMDMQLLLEDRASMEPRARARGNATWSNCERCKRLASMEPRARARGNVVALPTITLE